MEIDKAKILNEFKMIQNIQLPIEDIKERYFFVSICREIIQYLRLKPNFKNQNNLNYLYSELSLYEHRKKEVKEFHNLFTMTVRTINSLNTEFIFSNKNFDYEQEKWKKYSNKESYDGFIEKRLISDLSQYLYIYEISYFQKSFKQKNPKYFYSNEFLSKYQRYKVNYSIFSKEDYPAVKMNVIKKASLIHDDGIMFDVFNKSILNLIQKEQKKQNISQMDAIKFKVSNIKNELSDWFEKNEAKIAQTLIALKYWKPKTHKEFLSEYKFSPLFYEWWTKNPRGANLTFFEKIAICEEINYFKKPKPNKINGEIDLFIENYEGIEQSEHLNISNTENIFDDNYSEYKIVKKDNKITLKKYLDVLNILEKNKILNNKNLKLNITKKNDEFFEKINNNKTPLSKDQIEAYFRILNNSFSILYGNAGTGKTFLTSKIIKKFISLKETYILLAPTHRAVAVSNEMAKNLDIISDTIQSNKWTNKTFDNIIIDEASMIDDDMWKKLFWYLAENHNKRLVLLGDDAQLPPIRSFGLFSKIKEKKIADIIMLKENQRFKNNNKIKDIIENTKNGILPQNAENFRKYKSFKEVIGFIKEFVQRKNKNDKNVKIISPIKFGLFGTRSLLAAISAGKLKVDDEIIMSEQENTIKNKIYWNKTAKIIYINKDDIILNVSLSTNETYDVEPPWEYRNFKGKIYLATKQIEEDLPFSKSSAITVHSAQGSTFDNIILVIPPKIKMDNKMIYTAISRTKNDFLILKWEGDK